MGYKTIQDVAGAVIEVVFEAASPELTLEGANRIAAKHPWAREHLSPDFRPAQDLHEISRGNGVTLNIVLNEEGERLPPENLYVGVISGLREYGFRFLKNAAGEYEYDGFRTSYQM